MMPDFRFAVGWGLLIAVGAWVLYCTTWYYLASARPQNFPAGPKTLPFLGHLHIFPPTKGFLTFHEWGKQYGSIIGLKLGPQNVVVLNDYKHVQELLDKRGAIYSDRPLNHVANDVIYQNQTHILFIRYGEMWRAMRKAVQELLKPNRIDEVFPIQKAESATTLHQLLHDPNSWYDHVGRFTIAIVLASVFGLRAATSDSPRVKDLYHAQHQQARINEIGATPPLDIFPFLKRLPDFVSPWRSWAREIRREFRTFFFGLARESKEHMQTPGAPPCFFQRLVEMGPKAGLDDEHMVYLSGEMLEAGSDTTAAIILSFVLALAKNPAILRKCQEEVDNLCGTERSPGVEDFKSLPYIRAVMNETMRWRPVTPAAVPHALTQDDYYEGYFFPKGTIFIVNAWSIHRTDEYASPDEFIPERFLHNKFGIKSDIPVTYNDKRRVQYMFGAGRRVCPGQQLAENTMMLIMAKLAWAFNIEPATDSLSDSITDIYHGGILSYPVKFPVRFTPRSATHAEIIEREYQAELPFLSRFGA